MLTSYRVWVADGIRTMAATPHLYAHKAVEPGATNSREKVLAHLSQFQEKLAAAGIALKVIPGCDMPLSWESMQLLEEGQVLTINGAKRYLRRPAYETFGVLQGL